MSCREECCDKRLPKTTPYTCETTAHHTAQNCIHISCSSFCQYMRNHSTAHHMSSHHTTPYLSTPHHTEPQMHYTTPHCTKPHTSPYYTTLHCITAHHTTPHHTSPYHTTPHHITPHKTAYTLKFLALACIHRNGPFAVRADQQMSV